MKIKEEQACNGYTTAMTKCLFVEQRKSTCDPHSVKISLCCAVRGRCGFPFCARFGAVSHLAPGWSSPNATGGLHKVQKHGLCVMASACRWLTTLASTPLAFGRQAMQRSRPTRQKALSGCHPSDGRPMPQCTALISSVRRAQAELGCGGRGIFWRCR